jgi:hypothetical protein
LLGRHVGKELGARFVGGVVEFFAGMVVAELVGIARGEEGALVVVEPLRELRGAGIFEVNDGVFIAIEDSIFERTRGFVSHACVKEFGVVVDAFAVEAREDGGRRSSVEASVVKTKAKLHHSPE